jgi:hypothetical protein
MKDTILQNFNCKKTSITTGFLALMRFFKTKLLPTVA